MVAKFDPANQAPSFSLSALTRRALRRLLVLAAIIALLMLLDWVWSQDWRPSSSQSTSNPNEALVHFNLGQPATQNNGDAINGGNDRYEMMGHQELIEELLPLGEVDWPSAPPKATRARNGTWLVGVGHNKIWINDRDKKWLDGQSVSNWGSQINQWRVFAVTSWAWPITKQSPRSTWDNSATPISMHPLIIFVGPECQLCQIWQDRWPSHLPVRWVPVLPDPNDQTPSTTLWMSQWCDPSMDRNQCRALLHQQHVKMSQLGLWGYPVGVDHQGRVLSGWPDQNWLLSWLGVPATWSPPVAVAEQDL